MTELSGAAAWDAFVAESDPGSYLQQTAWARVKAVNGWAAHRIVAAGAADAMRTAAASGSADAAGESGESGPGGLGGPGGAVGGRIGAQILVRRPQPMPWAFAYAPRGPVAGDWTPASIAAFTDACRTGLRPVAGRVSHLRVDPEIEADGPHDPDGGLRRAFRAAGWRVAPPIQPASTRIIDLGADEAALWGDLRKKWRQYVNKARSGGIVVVDGDGARLAEFYRIYRETADRAGFLIRAESAYRDVWDAYAPTGQARLLFAQLPDGEPVATLFLVRCGPRVVEPYGGMTAAGADSRANYLLKWEAIRTSRDAGATSYDLWGLATGGIAHFKTGFGGREVRYIGAWDLVLDPLGRQAYEAAVKGRVRWARWRHGATGSTGASAFGGAD